jgi:hypothetical protein
MKAIATSRSRSRSRKTAISRTSGAVVAGLLALAAQVPTAGAAPAETGTAAAPPNPCFYIVADQPPRCPVSDTVDDAKDPPPPPPPCDLDRTGGIQGPCQQETFPFEADDPNQAPANRVTKCQVTLDGAAPPNDFNYPKVQFRSSISCDKAIHKIEIQARLYRGAAPAYDSSADAWLWSTGPLNACYGCSTVAPSRGPDGGGSADSIGEWTQRTYLRLMAPDAEGDPWVVVSGVNPGNPTACSPNQKVVVCYVDQKIEATPFAPDLP